MEKRRSIVSEQYRIRELEITRDVPNLVEMWKASDDQWPGTWSGGVEMTEKMIAEWLEREKYLNIYVVETGGQIVGFCSFHETGGEKDVGYVGVLNVQPDHQKRSLARRMLNRCTERCVELGYKQVTLHTWPGNLKSVPLYKKTGLYWVPDTSVHMRNFIPSILAMPCARPYFTAHDWYETFQRELAQREDDERWEGLKVYTYRWAAGKDMLTVWVDREARMVTAVETNGFSAASIATNIEPAKGLPTPMRWKLRNKRDRPMRVSVIANGTEHLRIEHRTALTLTPGESAELEATVDVAVDTPDVRDRKPVPAIRSLLIIDGEVVELATGMRPRAAVVVETEPKYVTLYPGVEKTVHLQLRNYQPDAVEATVALVPAPGLEVDWTERSVIVPGKSYAGAPVTLRATAGGVYVLQATAYLNGHRTAPQRLAVFSLGAGGVLGYVGEKETRLENEWMRLILKPRRGSMEVRAPQENVWLGGLRESVGPPFWPSELDDKEFAIDLVRENGCVKAVMTVALDEHPGLVLRREVTLGAGPLAEVRNAWINRGTASQSIQIQLGVDLGQREEATMTLPLAGGMVQSRYAEFPAAEEDVDKKPEAFSERWLAVTSEHGTFGLMWEETVVENEFGGWGGCALLRAAQTCEPQCWTPAGAVTLYAGPGDWQSVRRCARRLAGTDDKEEPVPVETRAVCEARLAPFPVVTVDDHVEVTLAVDNLRARPMTGQVQLATPEGLTVDQSAFELGQVTLHKPFERQVKLSLGPEATAYRGALSLRTQLSDTETALHAIRLGTQRAVKIVDAGETWTIDNGRTRYTVTPGFSGSLAAWVEDGTDHLLSPYPEVKTFGWMSPWYGGLTPLALLRDEMPGKLGQETFSAQDIQAPDARGIPWAGVRVSCQMVREQLVGLHLEVEYLTVGQSNVLKLVYRVRNETTAKRALRFGWHSFWQLDGTREHNTLYSAEIQRKPTPWGSWSLAGKWGLVTQAESGRTAIMVSPYPTVRLVDWDDMGGHLGFVGPMSIPASGIAERVCYIALCRDVEQARRYVVLKDYM
jgi:RimJ/RimL family protein N-acetyltransferase